MSKDNQPDNRRARKKKNIGKLPPDTEALRDNKNTKAQVQAHNND
jgi:hypothetical protein